MSMHFFMIGNNQIVEWNTGNNDTSTYFIKKKQPVLINIMAQQYLSPSRNQELT